VVWSYLTHSWGFCLFLSVKIFHRIFLWNSYNVFRVLTSAFSSVLGRNVNREAKLEPIIITVISMGFGSIILFIVSLIV
jgi:hypothetical protein